MSYNHIPRSPAHNYTRPSCYLITHRPTGAKRWLMPTPGWSIHLNRGVSITRLSSGSVNPLSMGLRETIDAPNDPTPPSVDLTALAAFLYRLTASRMAVEGPGEAGCAYVASLLGFHTTDISSRGPGYPVRSSAACHYPPSRDRAWVEGRDNTLDGCRTIAPVSDDQIRARTYGVPGTGRRA